ncbi:HAMP domain-containing sensor histidine kinase [Halalkalibacterium halodurans]|uniref:histidine kinase n=1 Tax=Halalkalibacterium halodurans TaxID=86665 RepID=A0A0M0KLS9_ALKHA|nr:HAMP domain-containing sensor histidine kinase [Halalkalibacterium halodurans]MED3648663.1 HAMP domain-containing sensor histidine kinase [Halalkalibacterium halodurans]MED4079373.1 HAMP domain-containing sensor histidine kinase [Halalkalibacterium halodurans]MED4085444.1 HAMP domain-containing sensor histidine kinase [Halalkalibacterium halodurans]MED4104432.1 HAMP domain-containing sensor histidine kinase [Halalkalibacterium halodurans]MED4108109.1 HAMP domain-containing sensor histidine 
MIRVNLTQRIWLAFFSLIFLVGLSIIIIYPISIKGTMTEETYRMIELAQARQVNPLIDYMNPPRNDVDFRERQEADTFVYHFQINSSLGESAYGDVPQPTEVLHEMAQKAFNQEQSRGRYELSYNGATIFYVVTKFNSFGREGYLISYMWDTYRDSMVNRLWERLLYILLLSSALSLLPAIWLKHYLRQPLILLGNRLEQIADRNWKEPFKWEGDEDFQKLSNQFERMRQNLVRYDQSQKTFIQHASHELKTPIMVIKSYAQSVKDGILPKDSIEKTMDVISEEANRMERRVIDMLYYTKLDSIKEERVEHSVFLFGKVAFTIEERFRMQREDVKIIVEGADKKIFGDEEQIEVLLENLIENALRYAKDTIWIRATEDADLLKISVENNGKPIPDADLPQLFNPFYKGNKGKFGLGLAIVKQIAELHQGEAVVENTGQGVKFTISIPAVKEEKEKKQKKRRDRKVTNGEGVQKRLK